MKLQNFFEPKRNTSFERHVFRKMKLNKNERIDTFVLRLREQADRCNFENNLEQNIKDQITVALRICFERFWNETIANSMKL